MVPDMVVFVVDNQVLHTGDKISNGKIHYAKHISDGLE
jgi:hypothetical protein